MLQLNFVTVIFVAYIVLHLSQFMNISYVNMCHFCQEVVFRMSPLNVTCRIAQDMPDPKISSMPKLEGVIRGIRTYQLKHANKQPKIRLPITPEI